MKPFAALAPYKLLFEIMIIGSLCAGVMIGVHEFLEHEREIGRTEVRNADAVALAAAKDAAHTAEAQMLQMRDEATQHATEREQTIRTLATAAGASSNSLRDTLTGIRNGVPNATLDALGKSVTTLTTILAECQGKYYSVAESADRHASDTQTLIDAWPKKVQP